jgi:hypothetical protein
MSGSRYEGLDATNTPSHVQLPPQPGAHTPVNDATDEDSTHAQLSTTVDHRWTSQLELEESFEEDQLHTLLFEASDHSDVSDADVADESETEFHHESETEFHHESETEFHHENDSSSSSSPASSSSGQRSRGDALDTLMLNTTTHDALAALDDLLFNDESQEEYGGVSSASSSPDDTVVLWHGSDTSTTPPKHTHEVEPPNATTNSAGCAGVTHTEQAGLFPILGHEHTSHGLSASAAENNSSSSSNTPTSPNSASGKVPSVMGAHCSPVGVALGHGSLVPRWSTPSAGFVQRLSLSQPMMLSPLARHLPRNTAELLTLPRGVCVCGRERERECVCVCV